jgi:hypothetical protein
MLRIARPLSTLVISAQAFHWLPQEVRYQKTAQQLKPQGYLAIFWNRYPSLEDPLAHELNQVYQQHAPEMVLGVPSGHQEKIEYWITDLNESDYFDLVEVKRYPWKERYTTRQYLGLLNTYSDHLRLSEERRQRLFAGIEAVLAQAGGSIEKPYEAVAYIARKLSSGVQSK